MQRADTIRTAIITLGAAILLGGCGGSDTGAGAAAAVRAPERAGDVFEAAGAEDRAAAPAILLAYVTGTHVMVVDGRDAFAGMTRLRGTTTADGALSLALHGDVSATLAQAGDSLALRFSSGEQVTMRRRAAAEGDR